VRFTHNGHKMVIYSDYNIKRPVYASYYRDAVNKSAFSINTLVIVQMPFFQIETLLTRLILKDSNFNFNFMFLVFL